MRRVRNWDVILTQWALRLEGKEFVWGISDCVSVLRGGLYKLYGLPVGPAIIYRTAEQAANIYQEHGGPAVELEKLGAVIIPFSYANTGDVCWYPPDGDDRFGSISFVITDKILYTEANEKIKFVPLRVLPPGAIIYRLPT